MILLLAGTSDARRLAHALHDAGVPALASLAGATREPAPLPIPTRHGGFGGDAGFDAFLADARPRAVIDATHPFAARVTARTLAACRARAVPHLRLERPGWTAGPGDDWTWAADEGEAARLVPEGATVFLATGRGSLPAFAGLRARAVHLRAIDPPTEPFPFPGGVVLARPPFTPEAEAETFRRLGVTHLVAKDSGAVDARAKLDAARALALPVVLIRRPPRPPGMRVAATVEEALAFAVAPSFQPA